MTDTDVDFSEFTPSPETGDLVKLAAMVVQAGNIDEELKQLEELKKLKKAQLTNLVEQEIPAFMLDHGGFTRLDLAGFTVEIEKPTFAGIPSLSAIAKERDEDVRDDMLFRRNRAIEILEEKAPHLLKRSFEVEFDRDEQEEAEALEQTLSELKLGARLVKGANVHPKTLAKYIKELENDSVALTSEERKVFGVLSKSVAKIKRQK